MQTNDPKALLERFSSNENIPPEIRERECRIYRGAAIWNKLLMGGSLVSAFSAAVICERPWPTVFALAATGVTLGVAKAAQIYMNDIERKIRWNHPFQ